MFEKGHVVRYKNFQAGIPQIFSGICGVIIEDFGETVFVDFFPLSGKLVPGHNGANLIKTNTGFYLYKEFLVDISE